MKNFKKVITVLLMILLIGTSQVFAISNDDSVVTKNKVWTIKLKEKIELTQSMKKGIVIKDSEDKVVNVSLELSSDGKLVLINPPQEGYKKGEYTLTINSNLIKYKERKVVDSSIINFIVKDELNVKEIAKNSQSVVYIETLDANKKPLYSGSGFIIEKNGVVVTNYHVLEECSYANVTLENGKKYEVQGVSSYNKDKDIAILKLKNATNLSIVKLGNSDVAEIGDSIVTIGSPNGYKNTVSTGIISSLSRKSDIRKGEDIQITAPISSGSSGGALFDMFGQCIGITYAQAKEGNNLGFVIPINEVKIMTNSSKIVTLKDMNGISASTGNKDLDKLISFVGEKEGKNIKNIINITKCKDYKIENTSEYYMIFFHWNNSDEVANNSCISLFYSADGETKTAIITNIHNVENNANILASITSCLPSNQKDLVNNDITEGLNKIVDTMSIYENLVNECVLYDVDYVFLDEDFNESFGLVNAKFEVANGKINSIISLIVDR